MKLIRRDAKRPPTEAEGRPQWAAANCSAVMSASWRPGNPLAVHLYLAEVDARGEDCQDGRVLDARGPGDLARALALGAQGEDAPDDRHHLVGHELAVDEVVAGLGMVDPLALAHGLLAAHAHLLGQLLAVGLDEGTEEVLEHPPVAEDRSIFSVNECRATPACPKRSAVCLALGPMAHPGKSRGTKSQLVADAA
jgi:hypothetical protein